MGCLCMVVGHHFMEEVVQLSWKYPYPWGVRMAYMLPVVDLFLPLLLSDLMLLLVELQYPYQLQVEYIILDKNKV